MTQQQKPKHEDYPHKEHGDQSREQSDPQRSPQPDDKPLPIIPPNPQGEGDRVTDPQKPQTDKR
jgi:hypothetical protein